MEKKYLRKIIGIAEQGEKRLRILFFQLALFATISIGVLTLIADFSEAMNLRQFYLGAGIVVGVVIAKASTLYNFRYIYKYIDVAGVKRRLQQIDA